MAAPTLPTRPAPPCRTFSGSAAPPAARHATDHTTAAEATATPTYRPTTTPTAATPAAFRVCATTATRRPGRAAPSGRGVFTHRADARAASSRAADGPRATTRVARRRRSHRPYGTDAATTVTPATTTGHLHSVRPTNGTKVGRCAPSLSTFCQCGPCYVGVERPHRVSHRVARTFGIQRSSSEQRSREWGRSTPPKTNSCERA